VTLQGEIFTVQGDPYARARENPLRNIPGMFVSALVPAFGMLMAGALCAAASPGPPPLPCCPAKAAHGRKLWSGGRLCRGEVSP
jgi:hypothetical protein